jgi:hypothetical protein
MAWYTYIFFFNSIDGNDSVLFFEKDTGLIKFGAADQKHSEWRIKAAEFII